MFIRPYFSDRQQTGVLPRGVDLLKEIAAAVHIPVIAIGGIHAGNARRVLEAGAAGVAVLSAIFSQLIRSVKRNG